MNRALQPLRVSLGLGAHARTRGVPRGLLLKRQSMRRVFSTTTHQGKSWPFPTARLFIDGDFVAAEDNATLPVHSPRDGAIITHIANASARDVDRAVASARRCFDQYATQWSDDSWPAASPSHRAAVLRELSSGIRRRSDELAWLETMDCGKPLVESKADMDTCAGLFEFYADLVDNQSGEETHLDVPEDGITAVLRREPLGVVGAITPWNFPLAQAVVKVAPALAAGCAVVLKPSPLASLTSLALAQLAVKANLPRGALNVITGGPPDGDAGEALGRHPGIDKLSFTGSGTAGSALLASGAPLLRSTALELGGKGCMVVCADADIDDAVDWALAGCFICSGQVCSATSRIVVDASVAEMFISKLVAAARAKLVVGDPLAVDTNMGPLVSRHQRDRVRSFVTDAQSDQRCEALLPASLDAWPGVRCEAGYYASPQVYRITSSSGRDDGGVKWPQVWREEIFGPVLCVAEFRAGDLNHAVELANDSPYGLAHAIFTTTPSIATEATRRLRAGIVWQNCSQPVYPSTPFGGCKASGFGREYGALGLEEYVLPKTVVTARKGHTWNWFG